MGDLYVLKECGHVFHYECIHKWVQQSGKCPLCKKWTTVRDLQKVFFDIPKEMHTMEQIEDEGKSYDLQSEKIEQTIENLKPQLQAVDEERIQLLHKLEEMDDKLNEQEEKTKSRLLDLKTIEAEVEDQIEQVQDETEQVNALYQRLQIGVLLLEDISGSSNFEETERIVRQKYISNSRNLSSELRLRAYQIIIAWLGREKRRLEQRIVEMLKQLNELKCELRRKKLVLSTHGDPMAQMRHEKQAKENRKRDIIRSITCSSRKPAHLRNSVFQIGIQEKGTPPAKPRSSKAISRNAMGALSVSKSVSSSSKRFLESEMITKKKLQKPNNVSILFHPNGKTKGSFMNLKTYFKKS